MSVNRWNAYWSSRPVPVAIAIILVLAVGACDHHGPNHLIPGSNAVKVAVKAADVKTHRSIAGG